jgi:hypothetical protein
MMMMMMMVSCPSCVHYGSSAGSSTARAPPVSGSRDFPPSRQVRQVFCH